MSVSARLAVGPWLRVLVCLIGLSGFAGLVAAPAQARDAINIGIQLEPPILDPSAAASTAIAEVVYGNVFETLVRLGADASVQPGLASAWHIDADGLAYTFTLRPGVRFHDGTPFDAQTVKFTLDRARAAESTNPQKSLLGAVKRVEVVDPLTVRVWLSRRAGGLLQSLAMPAFAMLAPASAATNATTPIGTGPFRFAQWRRGDRVVLERYDGYWGTHARLAQVVFKFIGDPSAAYAALMAGDVDVFPNFPAPENIAQFKADPRFAVLTSLSEGEVILSINNRKPPFDRLAVRRAISHALDRQPIIDGAMYGYGQAIGSHFPPQNPAYVDLTGVYPHDPARARALLAEAGLPEGFALTLKLPPPAYARRSGEIVAAQLAQAGIRVNIENLEWAQWIDQVFVRHDFDLSIVAHAEPLDYDIYGRDDYYFGGARPAIKATLAALDDSTDAAARTRLLQTLQRQIADEAINGFLFQYPKLGVADAQVHGLKIGGVIDGTDMSAVWVDEPQGAHDGNAPVVAWLLPLFGALALVLFAQLAVIAWRHHGTLWIVQRVFALLGTLLVATVVIFVVVQVVPGDPVRQMMGLQADPAAVAATRAQLGLDAAPLARYFHWVGGLVRGDLGTSYTYRVPVQDLIGERIGLSLPLAVYALVLATVIALPVALIAVAQRGRALDAWLTGATQLGIAIPNFWLGVLLVLVFAVGLRWVSAGGFPGWGLGLMPGLKALTLPALALALPQAAILARVLRAALLDTLHEAWMRTARAKGLSEWRSLVQHALPNALVPVLTLLGMQFAFLLAGGVIIENVFFLPGLGRLVFQAIVQRDLILVQGLVVLLVFAVVVVSFIVDLAYVAVDPRLHERRTA